MHVYIVFTIYASFQPLSDREQNFLWLFGSKDCDGSITMLHPMSVYSIIAIQLCMSHSRDAQNIVWYFRDWETCRDDLCRKDMRVVPVL